MDKLIGGLLDLDKPIGATLAKTLYYIGAIVIVWQALKMMWRWITFIDNDWDTALWGLIKTPFMAVITLLILRLLMEFYLAVFKIRDNVTGSAED